ncbi:hypothetical protein GN244_ATG19728 [Phytophthora infestans]|uniref:Uncharacterized protein n=1 Tax=Phytophthora infestans TaxID=4787 RepID=A0A833S3W1_PHYIN|nr:hypothetical protein GN244_ATG19728 [Phytophthora infestans]
MAARRETRMERDAFKARQEGRSIEDRHRLSAEHREYLNGERATDADFGNDEPSVPPAAAPPAVDRSWGLPCAPPRGRDACYLANAKRLMERRLADKASQKKKSPAKKTTTKTRQSFEREKRLHRKQER